MKPSVFILFLFFLFTSLFANEPITIFHVGDTHSSLEPTLLNLYVDKPLTIKVGGYSALASALKQSKKQKPNSIFLHSGDFFQGTLYFSKFQGIADVSFFNLIGLDAATLGNHEFDRGADLLNTNLFKLARFPILSANINFDFELKITYKQNLKKYQIVKVGKERIGVIGLTTIDTPNISNPGNKIKFLPLVKEVEKSVEELTKCKVNKIILLTHIGLGEDIELAKQISDVDIIVGGHSHTRLGDFTDLGLEFWGEYPTIVKDKLGNKVLIVHAWEWGKVLGAIDVVFTKEGLIEKYNAYPKLVVYKSFLTNQRLSKNKKVLLVDEDLQTNRSLSPYINYISTIKDKLIATAGEELNRGFNQGPGIIIADSMRWKTNTQIALINPGAIRADLSKGKVTVDSLYRVLPYQNSLVVLEMTGKNLIDYLERGINFQIKKYGKTCEQPFVYASGINLFIDPKKSKGKRVLKLELIDKNHGSIPILPDFTYSVTVNDFMVRGGDGYFLHLDSARRKNLPLLDIKVFEEFIQGKTLYNSEKKVFCY
ncbi:MAG: bifunctional metallophosphatase/5'-nucleotidase [Leptospiraceae bacterium]|nr:bifunctional metallophosphatase/5'-nucleotidase [Leptospiraceae bacterium]MCP5494412.1 bifunctional metallophosphatase/5'-nucleotidase [Leptospiraceae bacterium]